MAVSCLVNIYLVVDYKMFKLHITVIQKKSQYQGKYAMLSNDGSNSDESDGTAELEEEDENIDDTNNSEVSYYVTEQVNISMSFFKCMSYLLK